jgi:AcrR family transcriptional regulator
LKLIRTGRSPRLKPEPITTNFARQQHAALKASIAAATAELHAEKGAIATTYADIAKRAGVSLPTVYSHFPTQNELLQGCTAHVIAKAPTLPLEKIQAATACQRSQNC